MNPPFGRIRRSKSAEIFEAGNYWSSTENSDSNARNVNFSSGSSNNNNKTNTNYVRCVRGRSMALKSMKNFKLPIYHLLYQLVKYLYGMVRNMPREYKYWIGQDILRLAWQCLDAAMEAAKESGRAKAEAIGKLSRVFDRLKLRLRLASEVGAISEKCFAHLQENFLAETGRMIGGWRKWAE